MILSSEGTQAILHIAIVDKRVITYVEWTPLARAAALHKDSAVLQQAMRIRDMVREVESMLKQAVRLRIDIALLGELSIDSDPSDMDENLRRLRLDTHAAVISIMEPLFEQIPRLREVLIVQPYTRDSSNARTLESIRAESNTGLENLAAMHQDDILAIHAALANGNPEGPIQNVAARVAMKRLFGR